MEMTVFAGTFNPIHYGHLIMAETVRCSISSEKIIFIPSFIPPHKEDNLAEANHRYKMTELATSDNPYFIVSDIEFRMQGISYTINTINKLYEENPDIEGKIKFIIGADAYSDINSWYKGEELAELLDFVVLARPDCPKVHNHIINAPFIDISSSAIRDMIKAGKSIKYLVSDKVMEYIYEHRLYT